MNSAEEKTLNKKLGLRAHLFHAINGHLPLIRTEDIVEALASKTNISVKNAQDYLETKFTQIDKIRNLNDQREHFDGLPQNEKKKFIKSIFKIVEYQMMVNDEELH